MFKNIFFEIYKEITKNINVKPIDKNKNKVWLSLKFSMKPVPQRKKIWVGIKKAKDVDAKDFPVSHLKLKGTKISIGITVNKISFEKNIKFNIPLQFNPKTILKIVSIDVIKI